MGRVFAGTLAAVSLTAAAQAPPPERQPLERPPLPGFLPEKPPAPFVLPPAPLVPEQRLSSPVRLVVKQFRFAGATAFPEAELQALVARFTGRAIGNEELEEARLAVTRHYVAAGYVNSGAVIPDQAVGDGTVLIQVIEGRLAAIEVGGKHGFRPDYLRERMALAAGVPLNVQRVQERMQLLLQNPQIEKINAELGAGARPGEAVLRMDVTEGKKYSLGASLANSRSPSVGSVRAELNGAARNFMGFGEIVGLRVGKTQGLEDTALNLVVPVSAADTLLIARLERTDSVVIEPPFDLIDIRNKSQSVEIGLSHPVHRTLSQELSLGASLVHRDNASTLLGAPFSFVPGLADGKSKLAALKLAADWTQRSASEVLAGRLTLNHGLDAFGSTVSNAGNPDSMYRAWLAQGQWARRIGEAGQLIVRGDLQTANEALLPSEKFAVGGSASVRGYRENALVRDAGWVGSAEYRHELTRWSPLGTADATEGALEAAVFVDAGAARDRAGGAAPGKLASYGLGVRWAPWRGALAQLYKGFRLRDAPAAGDGTLQDSGVHFIFQLQKDF